MKKYLILLVVAVLLLAGCTYESYDNNYYGSDDSGGHKEEPEILLIYRDILLLDPSVSSVDVDRNVAVKVRRISSFGSKQEQWGSIENNIPANDFVLEKPMVILITGTDPNNIINWQSFDVFTGFTPNLHAGDHEDWLVVDELQEPVGDGTVPLAMTGNKSWPDLPTEQIELLGNDIQLDTDSRAALEKLKKNLGFEGEFSILLADDYSTEVTGYSQGGAMDRRKVLILMDAALYADKFNHGQVR